MRALIASGTGRYADPWHPFPTTSRLLGRTLSSAGFEVAIEDDVDAAMRALADVDLLVVNAGDPWRADIDASPPPDASVEGLAGALVRGIGVLAIHCAVSSLRDYPEWASAIGAMWIPGLSFHPSFGETAVTGIHLPDGLAVEDFVVDDERYCRLQRIGRSTRVAEFLGSDAVEPAAWIRQVGRSRIAVDVLGHDERSYESEGHLRLLAQLARWTVAGHT